METVQAKLLDNINKGTMNSFERLANTFQSNAPITDMDIDYKDPTKIPATSAPSVNNKQLVLNSTHSKKHSMTFAPGQTGASLARKMVSKRNRRGQVTIGVGIVKRHKIKASRK